MFECCLITHGTTYIRMHGHDITFLYSTPTGPQAVHRLWTCASCRILPQAVVRDANLASDHIPSLRRHLVRRHRASGHYAVQSSNLTKNRHVLYFSREQGFWFSQTQMKTVAT